MPPLYTYHVHSRSFLLVMVVSGFSVKAEASHSAFSVDFRVAEVNIKLNFPTCIANKMAAPMDAWSINRRKDVKDVANISCYHSLCYPLGDKVSMLTHTYPHKARRKIEVTICKITRLTAHFMCGLMSDLLICTCLYLKVWSYMTLNVLTETRCH